MIIGRWRIRRPTSRIKKIAEYQKKMSGRIVSLLHVRGESVTKEHVNQFQINLARPVELTVDGDGLKTFYFVDFVIEEKSTNNF